MRLLFSLLVLAGLSVTAAAEDEILWPDPLGQWRLVTRDAATTTSRCIGSTASPFCVIDTIEACYVRRQTSLCEIATGSRERDFGVEPPGARHVATRYRVDSIEDVVSDDQAMDWRGEIIYAWRPGDLRFNVLRRESDMFEGQLHEPFHPRTFAYFLRHERPGWRAVRHGDLAE